MRATGTQVGSADFAFEAVRSVRLANPAGVSWGWVRYAKPAKTGCARSPQNREYTLDKTEGGLHG